MVAKQTCLKSLRKLLKKHSLFDDPQKKYHASFLIRGYKAIVPGEKEWENNEKRKDCAPHDFWYDLFGGANMLSNGKFSIEWIDESDCLWAYGWNIKICRRTKRWQTCSVN